MSRLSLGVYQPTGSAFVPAAPIRPKEESFSQLIGQVVQGVGRVAQEAAGQMFRSKQEALEHEVKVKQLDYQQQLGEIEDAKVTAKKQIDETLAAAKANQDQYAEMVYKGEAVIGDNPWARGYLNSKLGEHAANVDFRQMLQKAYQERPHDLDEAGVDQFLQGKLFEFTEQNPQVLTNSDAKTVFLGLVGDQMLRFRDGHLAERAKLVEDQALAMGVESVLTVARSNMGDPNDPLVPMRRSDPDAVGEAVKGLMGQAKTLGYSEEAIWGKLAQAISNETSLKVQMPQQLVEKMAARQAQGLPGGLLPEEQTAESGRLAQGLADLGRLKSGLRKSRGMDQQSIRLALSASQDQYERALGQNLMTRTQPNKEATVDAAINTLVTKFSNLPMSEQIRRLNEVGGLADFNKELESYGDTQAYAKFRNAAEVRVGPQTNKEQARQVEIALLKAYNEHQLTHKDILSVADIVGPDVARQYTGLVSSQMQAKSVYSKPSLAQALPLYERTIKDLFALTEDERDEASDGSGGFSVIKNQARARYLEQATREFQQWSLAFPAKNKREADFNEEADQFEAISQKLLAQAKGEAAAFNEGMPTGLTKARDHEQQILFGTLFDPRNLPSDTRHIQKNLEKSGAYMPIPKLLSFSKVNIDPKRHLFVKTRQEYNALINGYAFAKLTGDGASTPIGRLFAKLEITSRDEQAEFLTHQGRLLGLLELGKKKGSFNGNEYEIRRYTANEYSR